MGRRDTAEWREYIQDREDWKTRQGDFAGIPRTADESDWVKHKECDGRGCGDCRAGAVRKAVG